MQVGAVVPTAAMKVNPVVHPEQTLGDEHELQLILLQEIQE
jgi:hypothetical protein